MKLTKSQLKEIIREEMQQLTEKPLKTNPKVWVPDKFDKVIDKLPYSKLTTANVIKLAKKFKVDEMDALRYVSYNQDVNFGLKEGKLNEDDFASLYADMIDDTLKWVNKKSSSIVKILNYQDKITGTKNAKAYNTLIDTHFRKFIIGAKKIQKMIKD